MTRRSRGESPHTGGQRVLDAFPHEFLIVKMRASLRPSGEKEEEGIAGFQLQREFIIGSRRKRRPGGQGRQNLETLESSPRSRIGPGIPALTISIRAVRDERVRDG